MPGDTGHPQAVAGRRQSAVVKILRTERRAFRRAEHEVLALAVKAAVAVRLKGLAHGRTHRDHASAAPGLWSSEAPIRVGFRDFNGRSFEIKPIPPQREDLADPHAGECRR